MMGIEIVDERQSANQIGSYPEDGELAAAIQKACFNNKLLLERGGRGGNVVRVLCAVNISQKDCEEMVSRFEKSVIQALASVRG